MQALIAFKGPLPMVFVGLSLNLGLLMLAVGLISTRAVPRWASVAIEVAALALVGGLFDTPIGVVGAAVLLVSLGGIGLRGAQADLVNARIVTPLTLLAFWEATLRA